MKAKKHFREYQDKLRFEAFVKSLLSGLAVGFTAGFVAALATWICGFDGFALSLAVWAGVSAISCAIFYFKAFYPSVMNNARRLDSLGLEERLITMVEFENDKSYIAEAQREDAKRALNAMDKKSLKLTVSRRIITLFSVAAVLGTAMITVNALSEYGFFPSGDEIIEGLAPEEKEVWIAVTYDVEDGGYIDGEADQLILYGTNASKVTAVPEDGFVFVEWSDGLTKPYRTDLNVIAEIEVFAVFEPDGEGEGEGDGEGEGEGEGDSDQQGEGEGEGEGESDQQGDQSNQSNTGGGANAAYNQIIDGETYYRQNLEMYREEFREYLEQHKDELTPEEIKIIQQYIDIV